MAALVNVAPLVRQQFNYNGSPVADGLLFTYAAGTTNKQATYTDSSGATPNTNPIVLDENGECDCWLDVTKSYKFVLSPSGDTDPPTNPYWTRDNLSPVSLMPPSMFGGVDAGSANAYAIALNPAPTSLTPGMIVTIQNIVASNTGASTLNVNELGALPIQGAGGNALQGGELVAGFDAIVMLNPGGTAWIIVGQTAGLMHGAFVGGNRAVFTASGTFPVPPGVTSLWVSGCGAGGGGGAGGGVPTNSSFSLSGGGGGGGGAGDILLFEKVSVSPGASLAVAIGAAGIGGSGVSGVNAGNSGTQGGTTSLSAGGSPLVSAAGGGGANGGNTPLGTQALISGGYGGYTGGQIGGNGFYINGNAPVSGLLSGAGGIGASLPFGTGGSGARGIGLSSAGDDGHPPSGYGSGGGGGSGASTLEPNGGAFAGGAGADGAPGILIIEW